MKWLPIVRMEDNIAYVKTIRGIEPCRIAKNFCHNAKVGQYALCKSVRQTLFMVNYTTTEVKA